ncbi:MAG: efflux RND transporter periplasmic adaptor subunit [Idiomarina sp.]|nr:efflux RND transporter periplasmic adaptor subunit [Idiomarina sp.]
MRTHIFLFWLLSVAAMAALTGCQNADATPAPETAEQTKPDNALPVETLEVSRATMHASFTTTTVLEALDEADVIARVSGIVEDILVEEGDYVERGQILAEIDKERFEQAMHQVAAELRGVEQELRRMQEMANRQMASADAVERLQANRDTLKARYRLAEIDVEAATLRAPISGVIAQRYVKTGNLVQQHERQGLFHIVDLSSLQATLHIPERDITQVIPGQAVELEFAQQQIQATVTRVSPAVDRVAGTFRVTVEIENPEGRLRAGMFARARLHYQHFDDALRVPHYALVQLDSQQYVFVVEDGIATRRKVDTGIRDGQWVQVLDGLSDNARVVITGQNNLNDTAPVIDVNRNADISS